MKNKLRMILAERKIKKGEFAKMVGITHSTLTLISKEESTPTLQVAMRIAQTLELKVEDIWYFDE
ncbi:helix-turn-helix transcriptional regulator [Bacillus sp. AFS017336]|uniref:helix-turn-helix transcriptional regulator n=1 Tax=Bacillus sp. AFS017336 TaxID=2033489 RepID=UPI000BEF6F51|nr:helix-turn-helix domain-containing protein [Bacillus sp. AFS017336]PEL13801.1 transcriptional regulator [Bacillus sp. AFS017336]